MHRLHTSRNQQSVQEFNSTQFWHYLPRDRSRFPGGSDSNESACNAGDPGSFPGSGRFSGEGSGYHSSILACRIPWKEEPGGLQSMGSQRVRHYWVTHKFRSRFYRLRTQSPSPPSTSDANQKPSLVTCNWSLSWVPINLLEWLTELRKPNCSLDYWIITKDIKW